MRRDPDHLARAEGARALAQEEERRGRLDGARLRQARPRGADPRGAVSAGCAIGCEDGEWARRSWLQGARAMEGHLRRRSGGVLMFVCADPGGIPLGAFGPAARRGPSRVFSVASWVQLQWVYLQLRMCVATLHAALY
eukprot:5558510-Prymnesium_polylepis.1